MLYFYLLSAGVFLVGLVVSNWGATLLVSTIPDLGSVPYPLVVLLVYLIYILGIYVGFVFYRGSKE